MIGTDGNLQRDRELFQEGPGIPQVKTGRLLERAKQSFRNCWNPENLWADWNQEEQGHTVFSFFLCFTKLLWAVQIKNVIVLVCVKPRFLNLKGTMVFKEILLNYSGTSLGKLCLICGPTTVMHKTPQQHFPNWISSVATTRIQPH